jgi:hypothetical protein
LADLAEKISIDAKTRAIKRNIIKKYNKKERV